MVQTKVTAAGVKLVVTYQHVLQSTKTIHTSVKAIHGSMYGRIATAAVRPAAPLYPEASSELLVMFGDVLTGAQDAETALDIAVEKCKERS